MKCATFITILFIISNLSFAQVNNFQLTLKSNITFPQCSIEKLIGDSLEISQSGETQWIKVDSILEIRQVYDSQFWTGAGIGFLVGAIAGGVIAKATSNDSEPSKVNFNFDMSGLAVLGGIVLGSVTGFTAGGIIGASAGSDEVYELSQHRLEQKLKIVEYIISKERKN